ncbi:MAG: transglycosylase SLT domain-containing protein [Bdellovibrionales bacterium]
MRKSGILLFLVLSSALSEAETLSPGGPDFPAVRSASPTRAAPPLLVGGRRYFLDVFNFPPPENLLIQLCRSNHRPMDKRNLCHGSRRRQTIRSLDSAAKTLHLPVQALTCLIQVESEFYSGRTSKKGAKGVTQFIPSTATYFESLMARKPDYQSAWRSYIELRGVDRQAEFNTASILSDEAEHAGVQIFASALYWRHELNLAATYFRARLGPPRQPKLEEVQNMFRYLLIAYNAGGGPAKVFARAVREDPKIASDYAKLPIPPESRIYLRKFDTCLITGQQRKR